MKKKYKYFQYLSPQNPNRRELGTYKYRKYFDVHIALVKWLTKEFEIS